VSAGDVTVPGTDDESVDASLRAFDAETVDLGRALPMTPATFWPMGRALATVAVVARRSVAGSAAMALAALVLASAVGRDADVKAPDTAPPAALVFAIAVGRDAEVVNAPDTALRAVPAVAFAGTAALGVRNAAAAVADRRGCVAAAEAAPCAEAEPFAPFPDSSDWSAR
jgi:hypothetical protein